MQMAISEERFDFAEGVIESGAYAAQACLHAGKSAVDSVEMLVGGLRETSLNQEGLLELLAVALMMIVKEREQARLREETHG